MSLKTSVLIVDDEVSFTFFVKKNLEASGRYDVAVCNEAAKAVERARALRPNLILLDVMMPGTPGEEIAVQLKQYPETKSTPVVFLTALVKAEETSTDPAHEIGGHKFVAKPVKMQELMKVIDEVVASPRK